MAQHHALGPARSSRWCRASPPARPDRPRRRQGRRRRLANPPMRRSSAGRDRRRSSVCSRAEWRSAARAPLSARMCATCARLSSGLIGTCTSPARAAASGRTQASSVLAIQLATRSPGLSPICKRARRRASDSAASGSRIAERLLAGRQREAIRGTAAVGQPVERKWRRDRASLCRHCCTRVARRRRCCRRQRPSTRAADVLNKVGKSAPTRSSPR